MCAMFLLLLACQVEFYSFAWLVEGGVPVAEVMPHEVWCGAVAADPGNRLAAGQADPAAKRCNTAPVGPAVPGRCGFQALVELLCLQAASVAKQVNVQVQGPLWTQRPSSSQLNQSRHHTQAGSLHPLACGCLHYFTCVATVLATPHMLYVLWLQLTLACVWMWTECGLTMQQKATLTARMG
eukprot:GHRQ01034951.1.p1 GENE.GHRQ01034951.1~~GHRQ01034951.1.p1  ORF type:complete len:182 (+),score=13.51 GHRQ01034951.1:210-755(+)